MDMYKTWVDIDRYKLETFISQNFSTKIAFCKSVGRSDSWLCESLKRRRMSLNDVLAIKGAHGIDITVEKSKEVNDVEIVDLLQSLLNEQSETNRLLNEILHSVDATEVGVEQILDSCDKVLKPIEKPKAYFNKAI